MRRGTRLIAVLVAAMVSLAAPLPALAGMPVPYTLRELARLRFETISFFILVLLVCACLVQLIWNSLRSGFARLPRLTYGKALGVVVLWGLLFSVVLAMISGARELMTPGAWERNGATYRLKPPEPPK